MSAARAFADVLARLADGAVIDWVAAERAAVGLRMSNSCGSSASSRSSRRHTA